MTSRDEQDLRDLQAELLETEQSPWQPCCVARAFHSAPEPFSFTMQAWMDLDAAESPFLLGSLPEAERAIGDFEVAFRVFGHQATTPENCEAEELIHLGRMMIEAILCGFSMRLKLAPPEGSEARGGNNGLGDWLPVLACLKSQLGFTLVEALHLPVAQAFALIAAHRCNEGWSVAGETYANRDVREEDAA